MAEAKEPGCEVLIIGGGPAGFTAALYAARAGLRTLVVSPGALTGMMARAPQVGNFPGQTERLTGRQILAKIRQQALAAGAQHVQEAVSAAYLDNGPPFTVAAGQQLYTAAALIIASGAMGRAEKVPGEEQFEGRGVARCVACDGPLFKGQPVLVVGEDEHAADEALALAGLASSVTLVAPTARLPLEPDVQEALCSRPNLTVETGLRLAEIVGDDTVTGAVFTTPHGEHRTLKAAGIFLYLRGAAPATEFLQGTLERDERGYLITDELMQTSRPGVFAAGDVRSKQVRQMVVAAAEGAIAALAAERFLRRTPSVRWDRGAAPR